MTVQDEMDNHFQSNESISEQKQREISSRGGLRMENPSENVETLQTLLNIK